MCVLSSFYRIYVQCKHKYAKHRRHFNSTNPLALGLHVVHSRYNPQETFSLGWWTVMVTTCFQRANEPTVLHVHSILHKMCTKISVTYTFLFCFLTYELMLCIHKYERLFIPQIQLTIFHKFVILVGLINSTLRATCTLKQAQLKYAGCRPTCTVHKVPSHI